MNERVKKYVDDKRQPLTMLGIVTVVGGLVIAVAVLNQPSEAERVAESKAKTAQLVEDIKAATPRVRYEVSGTTTQASITMETPTGTSQQSNIDVPLRTKSGSSYLQFAFSRGDFVYLSAQNSKAFGSVTCRITTEAGEVISENTATGGYAIAACKGEAR